MSATDRHAQNGGEGKPRAAPSAVLKVGNFILLMGHRGFLGDAAK
jgi:hypothetical protein